MNQLVDRREEKLRIDKSINIGGIIGLVMVLLALLGLSNRLESRLTAVETKVDFLMYRKAAE